VVLAGLGVVVVALALIAGGRIGNQTGASGASGNGGSVDQASVTRAEDGREDTVAAMLTRRGAAVAGKDRGGFLATVTDDDAQFAANQSAWFDNLAAVGFAQWSFELRNSAAAIPDAAKALAAQLSGGAFASAVDTSYRITGYDNAAQRYQQVLVFVPRHGRWLVAGRFDPADAPAHRELWDIGKVNVLPSAHGEILGLEPVAELRTYAAEVDRAVPRVDAVVTAPWAGQVLVEVTRTEEEMATLLGGAPATYRKLAAVTRGELGTDEASSAADRIIVNPKAYRELSDVGRRVIMGHEITHVAVRASTQTWTPRWLAEGLADYVGYRDSGLDPAVIAQELAADVRRGKVPTALPTDAAFAAGNPDLAQAYEMSWLACRLIAERHGGPATLLAFYTAVGAPGGVSEVDQAFSGVLSMSVAEFTAQWRDFVRSELG
jgi:hypothetical protein